ncbi:MAG TPA: hypothetical protein VF897_01175 [Roseiflexaceae bacterium]
MPNTTIGFGLALILQGIGGYVASGRASKTALIPAIPGLLLALLGVAGRREKLRVPAMHGALAVGLLGVGASFAGARRGGNPRARAARALMAATCGTYAGLGVRSFLAGRCAAARRFVAESDAAA